MLRFLVLGKEIRCRMHRTEYLKRLLSKKTTLVAALAILAFTTRILPISISSFPFNNDSLTECRMAEDIIAAGRLDFSGDSWYYDTHSTVTPVYNILLAFCSASLGIDSFGIAQIVVAAIAVLSVVGGYLIMVELTGSRRSAFLGGLTLSLFGTLVFLTGSAWKGAIGS